MVARNTQFENALHCAARIALIHFAAGLRCERDELSRIIREQGVSPAESAVAADFAAKGLSSSLAASGADRRGLNPDLVGIGLQTRRFDIPNLQVGPEAEVVLRGLSKDLAFNLREGTPSWVSLSKAALEAVKDGFNVARDGYKWDGGKSYQNLCDAEVRNQAQYALQAAALVSRYPETTTVGHTLTVAQAMCVIDELQIQYLDDLRLARDFIDLAKKTSPEAARASMLQLFNAAAPVWQSGDQITFAQELLDVLEARPGPDLKRAAEELEMRCAEIRQWTMEHLADIRPAPSTPRAPTRKSPSP